jgi:hypothetical protein
LEVVYGSFVIPPGLTGGTNIIVKIDFMNDEVQSGVTTCRWCVDYEIYAYLDLQSSKTTTTICVNHALPNNAAAGTFLVDETMTMLYNDADNPLVGGETVSFKFYREGADAADDMGGDAILISLTFLVSTGGN